MEAQVKVVEDQVEADRVADRDYMMVADNHTLHYSMTSIILLSWI
jgi:hypothetical protein